MNNRERIANTIGNNIVIGQILVIYKTGNINETKVTGKPW